MADAGPGCESTSNLEALFLAIQDFRGRPKADRSPTQLGVDLVDVRRAIDLLELEFAETAGAFAATEEYEYQGSTTPIEWIRHNCKMTGAGAADRVNAGDQLARLPLSTTALVEGQIGFAHLAVIARTASALKNSSHAFVESTLLDMARTMSVGKLAHQVVHVRHAADPEGVAAQQRGDVESRRLTFSPLEDGNVQIGGVLDQVGAASVRTALEPLAQFEGAEDQREYPRRLADALVELATLALDRNVLPSRASQRPHLQVSTTLDTLREIAGAPAGELEFSLPISAKTVQRMACDSSIIRILLDSDSKVIDVGRARRVVSTSLRRQLDRRDQECQWPGCSKPAAWCAAHHLVHWARGGKTDLENLALLCHRHHWMVHEGGWELAWGADGEVRAFPQLLRALPWARSPDYAAA